jgi:nucleoside-diphosphate-sugar epimerase
MVSVPVIDAAFAAGVKHFVFSSLPDTVAESNGKYDVAHVTSKAKIEKYIRYANERCCDCCFAELVEEKDSNTLHFRPQHFITRISVHFSNRRLMNMATCPFRMLLALFLL